MWNLLQNLLNRAALALSGSLEPRVYRVEQHGSEVDAKNLCGDFSAVGKDLRKVLKREQTG